MKTYKEWEDSNLEWDEYLKYPTQIDQELYLHIVESVAPSYDNLGFTQSGEATDQIDGVSTFDTVSSIDGRYFYLGQLPWFKDNNY